MRITHLITSLDPAAGGPPMVVLRLAAAQANLGHDVSIISYDSPAARPSIDKTIAGLPYIEKVKIHWLAVGGRLETALGLGLAQKLAPLLADREIVQLHGVWETMLRVAATIAEKNKTPYVVMPHGMLDRWSMAQKKTKKRIAMALAYKRMLDRAAYLHVLNEDEMPPIRELGIATPMKIVPNGVFLEEIEPLPTPGGFRAGRAELGDDPYILFLSRLHFKKGLDYLAGAFAKVAAEHDRVRLVVAGPDGGALNDFEKQVNEAGLAGRVHVVGPIYGPLKYEALVDAACFCLPSRQEGFSIAITESLACGTPVVISTACHFPEVAQAHAGHVVPLEIDRIAQSLLDLLGDESKRQQMSENAVELIHQRYTWPKIAEQTLEAYQKAVGAGVDRAAG